MASYTVYLRERHPGMDRRNAQEALSLLCSAGVHLDVERGPNAVNQMASRTGRSVHALRLPQIFHGKKHVGGVGPLKKYLAARGQRERKAVEDFDRRNRAKVLKAGIEIGEWAAEWARSERDHALQRAKQAEMARRAELRQVVEMKAQLRAEETEMDPSNKPEGQQSPAPASK